MTLNAARIVIRGRNSVNILVSVDLRHLTHAAITRQHVCIKVLQNPRCKYQQRDILGLSLLDSSALI